MADAPYANPFPGGYRPPGPPQNEGKMQPQFPQNMKRPGGPPQPVMPPTSMPYQGMAPRPGPNPYPPTNQGVGPPPGPQRFAPPAPPFGGNRQPMPPNSMGGQQMHNFGGAPQRPPYPEGGQGFPAGIPNQRNYPNMPVAGQPPVSTMNRSNSSPSMPPGQNPAPPSMNGHNQPPRMPGPPMINGPPGPGLNRTVSSPNYSAQGPPRPGMPPPQMQSDQRPRPPGSINFQQPPGPPRMEKSPQGLPVPFHGRAQYSHQLQPNSSALTGVTPTNSEPASQKSSRAPSPVSNNQVDALEGGQPFQPGQQPLMQPNVGTMTPPPQEVPRTSGIAGKRVYPKMQQTAYSQPPPPGAQTGPATGVLNNTMGPQQTGGQQTYMGTPQQNYTNQTQPPNYGDSQQKGGQMPGYMGNNTSMPNSTGGLNDSFNNMRIQGDRALNLLQEKHLIPSDGIENTKPNLSHDFKKANCNPDIFRCTLSSIPNSQSLLNKARLPLGILIHPFKDLSQLPVIQSSVIVRCRSCRTYINPFVAFVDTRRWKCNLCFRVNELPEEFNYDPVSKTYGEPQRRPEIKSATIEFIAPSEYMLRPPQPAVYLYVLDVSFNARETGYLQKFCDVMLEEIDRIPGDSRTQIGFITFDRSIHFYSMAEGSSQPQMLVVSDIDDVFLPSPDNLLVNLHESKELVTDLITQLPNMFENNMETGSALGAALQIAYKLMSPTGGRVAVFQTQLPTVGPGALKNREDPNERAGKKIHNLGPATDFYKKLALDCSAQQIAVDLFLLNSQYADIGTIAGISKYSGGCIHYFPGLHTISNPSEVTRFEGALKRYISRKIGYEAVMRIRCTRGLSIHTFHGNFFVRSTDLLSLPNINPDAGFGMQMSIEDNLETNACCFQAALLYTSAKGERRIRVHTLCLPVTNQLSEVIAGADQQGIIGLLAKMAVDRSLTASMSESRDAMLNAAVDMLSSFGTTLTASQRMGQLPCPFSTRLMPLLVLAMLKSAAFRVGASTKLDDRVFALEQCKTLPLCYLIQYFYPHLYPVHALDDKNAITKGDSVIPQPPLLQLSAANLDRHGVYIMDAVTHIYMMIGGAVSDIFCQEVLDLPNFQSIPDGLRELPELDNPTSERLRSFLTHLNDQKPSPASLLIMREDSRFRTAFYGRLVEDRTESTMSYYEFLQHLQKDVKS